MNYEVLCIKSELFHSNFKAYHSSESLSKIIRSTILDTKESSEMGQYFFDLLRCSYGLEKVIIILPAFGKYPIRRQLLQIRLLRSFWVDV